MPLKRVDYTDPDGRLKAVLLPEDSDDPSLGVPIGPPPLSNLGLPLEYEVRLNNELYHRGIITGVDAIKRRAEIMNAINATLKMSVDSVLAAYLGDDFRNARSERSVEEPKRSTKPVARPTRKRN